MIGRATGRSGGAALVAALLLAGSVPGQAAHPAPSDVPSILERSRRTPAQTAAELARLGSGAIPAMLEALASTRDESTREAVFLALRQLPILDLRAHLKRRTGEPMPDELRRAMIEVLGRCGNAFDLETMVRAATGAASTGEEDGVARTLELAAGRLLDRDGSTYARVAALAPASTAEVRDALFAAVAARECPESLHVFARVAREAPELAPLALAHLARGATRAPRPVDPEIVHGVREILDDPSAPGLPEAALAAGLLDDHDSIPRLIALVDDPRAGVRANAEWSLETLSGLDLRGGPDRWTAWYREEEAWRREAWPKLELDLASGVEDRIAFALESIAGRRCHRHELARAVARLLRNEDPGIVALACDTLRLLRSSAVRADLEACLDHGAPAVREAAASALAEIEREAADLGRPGRSPSRRRGQPGA